MPRARSVTVFHRMIPAGGWLFLARIVLRSARASRQVGLIGPRLTLAWVRAAGKLYRIGFAVWRVNGGRWK